MALISSISFKTAFNIEELLQIIFRSGQQILDLYNLENIKLENHKKIVTKADMVSHQIISEYLVKYNLPIISEESYKENDNSIYEKYWLIDPLDGTKEFISRNDEFTVNVALIQNKKPIFGLIYAPVTKFCWLGINNSEYKEAYKIDIAKGNFNNIIQIHCREPNYNNLCSLVSRSHSIDNKLKKFYQENRLCITKQIEMGSSLKFCYIAEGKADLYPRLGPTMEWDIAAAQAVLEGAGGYIYIAGNNNIVYGKKKLKNPAFIATNFKQPFQL
jgi:3'(2'), 5'-bisphosphate nucleotidase